MSLNFLPSTPPAAFNSSKARAVPLCEDCPKLALPPVSAAEQEALLRTAQRIVEAVDRGELLARFDDVLEYINAITFRLQPFDLV